jgi:DNA polymerase-3 subunit delta
MADAPDKPVYLLTGSDRPKIDTALARLRRHFAPEATETVSALVTAGEAAVALCNAGSLFGDARLVVVEDVDGLRDGDGRLKGGWKAADVEAVVAYLASPSPDTVLALVGQDVKKTTPLSKACAKSGTILAFSVAKKAVQGWVAKQFAERGVRAEAEACAALVQLVGEDLQALSAEMDKLATWAAGEPIGEREVMALVAPAADIPIYELAEAWAVRDAARALDASEVIFERESKPRRDTAARLAGALGTHLSRLRAIKRLADDGVRPKEAAAKLKLNPFHAGKLYTQAEGFSSEELRDAVVLLAELDGALKGQSKLTPDLEVQRTLVALTSRPGPPTRARTR